MSSCLFILLPGVRPPQPLLRWCRNAGVEPLVHLVDADTDLPPVGHAQTVILLGGAMTLYDPLLPRQHLGRFISQAVSRGLPTLGMGSGAHLIAWSLGAHPSMPEQRRPSGLSPVTRTAHGRLDPILSALPAGARWPECNELALTDLPVDAEVLAVDDSGLPLIARIGPSTWCLQGFPSLDRDGAEAYLADRSVIEQWPDECPDLIRGVLPLLDDACADWEGVFTRFFSLRGRRTAVQ